MNGNVLTLKKHCGLKIKMTSIRKIIYNFTKVLVNNQIHL